jgi:hypothetical protein
MFLRRSVQAVRGCEKSTPNKENIKRKYKVVVFHVHFGLSYPTDCNGSLHIGLGHQLNQSRHFWWLHVKEFGFC